MHGEFWNFFDIACKTHYSFCHELLVQITRFSKPFQRMSHVLQGVISVCHILLAVK